MASLICQPVRLASRCGDSLHQGRVRRVTDSQHCQLHTQLARWATHSAAAQHRRRQRAAAEPPKQDGGTGVPQGAIPGPAPEPKEDDMWEGERFNLLGQLAAYLIPLVAVAAVAVGLFASSTYDEGATVFLDSPKSADDTVKLIPAEDLQRD